MKRAPAKSVENSATRMVQVVLPNDTNFFGNVLGGRVMHWIDLVGAIVAFRHSRKPVVTASMERVDFHLPVRLGAIVELEARMNAAFRTSMEVQVEVFAEDPRTGQRGHTSSATLTYVALDDSGRPSGVPPLRVRSKDERSRQEEAVRRKRARKNGEKGSIRQKKPRKKPFGERA